MNERYGLNVGVSAMGVYVPRLRVDLNRWCHWTGNSWAKTRAVIGTGFRMPEPSESIYTMAATAVLRLLIARDLDASQIAFLGFGTESSTDNAVGAAIIKGMVNQALKELGRSEISRHCEVPEFKQACLGGIYALKAACRWVALDGRGKHAIVVSADTADYQRGSSGEATQGAGAVAMWVEEDPQLFQVDFMNAGSASDYRGVDFRKPFARHFLPGYAKATQRLHDFPVFSGKYSTTCYIDEAMHAVECMNRKLGIGGNEIYAQAAAIFLHRPYHRMPENALSALYLWGLARSDGQESENELRLLCHEAGAPFERVRAQMRSAPNLFESVLRDDGETEVYREAMALARYFRTLAAFKSLVAEKMSLGTNLMKELGNLYTAALPAWVAAGIEEAFEQERELGGLEFLLVGYGSGDAAEAFTIKMVSGWRENAGLIGMKKALDGFVDLSQSAYEALHDGNRLHEVGQGSGNRFVVERVGDAQGAHFQDVGVEYYRFVP